MRNYLLFIALFFISESLIAVQEDSGKSYSKPDMLNGKFTISITNGDTLYTLMPEVVALRPPSDNPIVTKSNVRANNTSSYGGNYMDLSHIPESYSVDKSKDVGEISISQSSSNGAVGYNIPISAYQASNGLNPTVQITYNSMSGNGVAGYGWQIGGLSAISTVNATTYYDGISSATQCNTLSAYALDAMRLIDLKTGTSFEKYYQTEQGNVKVTAYMYAGIMSYFRVYYPNGNITTYGYEGNTSAKVAYPLTKMKDLSGNVINYSYSERNNVYYVSEINYGGREDSSPISNYAKMTFTYENRADATTAYVAGLGITQDLRLKEVKSYFNGQLLRTYGLTYTNATASLLKQVDCSADSKSLNPLVFYYGENNTISRYDTGSILLTTYFNNSVSDMNLIKGKFTPNSSSDGLIEYPQKSSYGPLVYYNGTPIQYGSTYNSAQKLLTYDLSDGMSIPAELTADAGLLMLTAMDVDGDGKDELVKMNSSVGSSETITFNVYDLINRYGQAYAQPRYSFGTTYGGVVAWRGYYSAAFKTYLTGDFLGTGKQTVLSITYNQNIKGESVQSWATMVDFDNKSKSTLYDKACFSLNSSDRLFVIDFDGDGKADLCHISSSGTKIYTFNAYGTMDQIASYSGLTTGTFNKTMLLGDINGDDKTDIVISPMQGYWNPAYDMDCRECDYCVYGIGSSCRNPIHVDPSYQPGGNDWQIYYSTGATSRFNIQTITAAAYEDSTKIVLQDMNGDGRADLVINSNSTISFYPSVNGKLSSSPAPQTLSIASGSRFTTGNVMTAWQMSQLFSIDNYNLTHITFTGNLQRGQLLTGAVTSMGIVNKHQYCNLQNSNGNYDKGSACSYPYRNLAGNLYVLAKSDSYLSGGRIASVSNAYIKGTIDLRGRGFLGFEQVTAYDNIRSTTATQQFDPTNFGVLKSMDAPTTSANYNYNITVASNKIASVTLANKTENNKLTGTSVTSNYTYDAYENPTQITDSYSNGYISTENTYSNMTGIPYKLGVVTKQKVTSFWMGQTATTTRYIPVYNSSTGLPIVVVNYNNDNAVSSTVYTYQNGLITKESVTNYSSSTPLATTYAYDGMGRLQRKTDPLGNYNDYAYNMKGQLASVTNHKGNITSYIYDNWGSKAQTSYPDGVTETAALSWASAPSGTLTQATVTATGKPTEQSFADALGRGIRKGEQCFDGSWLYTDQVYDSRGRMQKVSLPFKSGAPTQWNTYSYDDYDRLLSLSYASGKTDSYSYTNLSVTATIDGVAKTTTKNSKGQVVSVSDPAGTITYNLRPDGQPSSIVAPGGITTSFEYDGYGRQTKLIDPSAGTRTFGYDAAGNLNSETDALNKVTTTTYDAYNRVTNKDVAGELTTNYVYNLDGQLTSVSSSNGTGQSYTYDGLMRVATATETAPDGKYLQKGYTYSSGVPSAIVYATPDGTIATENYLYSYGNLAEIKLNNSASVWKLTAENDMGLATGATTGSLTRTYGYDTWGLPTARMVKQGSSTLQDFGYNFDPATGNLNWRRDNTRALQESFSYDNLNRLTGFGGITMAYDTKGNITNHPLTGSYQYGNADKPYAVTGVTPYGTAIPLRNQNIAYNALQRPSSISENGYTATLVYDATGDRAKMTLTKDGATQLTRYYIGGQYETETGTAGSKEKLYLGGDAYSAAAVYVKENGGSWNIYYICRDYLGSITHVVNAAGSLTQELSYDPWGRLRDPATQVAYTPDTEPVLFLSRGYTGHEHLTVFGLINMNARLYDAALGRFLSPDPYVQAPDFSQNFNRYSYCVNNPLKFTDPNGKFFWFIIAAVAVVNAAVNVYQNWDVIKSSQGWSAIGKFAGFATIGAGQGILSTIYGPAGGIIGGTLSAGLNSTLRGDNLNTILSKTGVGFASSLVGVGVGYGAEKLVGSGLKDIGVKSALGINIGTKVSGSVAQSFSGTLAGALIQGKSFKQSFQEASDWRMLTMASASGIADGFCKTYANGKNNNANIDGDTQSDNVNNKTDMLDIDNFESMPSKPILLDLNASMPTLPLALPPMPTLLALPAPSMPAGILKHFFDDVHGDYWRWESIK